MKWTLYTVFPDDIKAEWNALLENSVSHVPFLRYEYLRAWWATRGGGEWTDGQLVILAARRGDELVGVAPLFSAARAGETPALHLLGSVEISDYLDLIVREADLPGFLDGLLEYLAAAEISGAARLDLSNLLDSSPTLPALQAAAQRAGWTYAQQQLEHSPYITLPGDWETYLAGIDKKQRHEIRRKMRRAEEAPLPVRWYVVSDADALEGEMDAFLELMAYDPEKTAFLTPTMRDAMRNTMRCAFENGCLQLAFLTIDGRKAAAYLNFDYLNRIWVYNSGLNRDFNEYSPGWVLLGHLLQWANENGRAEFDFMRGDEDYKYRFGAVDRFVMRATLTRPT